MSEKDYVVANKYADFRLTISITPWMPNRTYSASTPPSIPTITGGHLYLTSYDIGWLRLL